MKSVFVFLTVSLALVFALVAWNPGWVDVPDSETSSSTVMVVIPGFSNEEEPQWRVITRRMVWKKGFDDLLARLKDKELSPSVIAREEPVELHAYDDVHLFHSFGEANQAKQEWKSKGFEADVLETGDGLYRVGLGRYYLNEYAEELEQRLKQKDLPYRYQRRTLVIPSYRLVFPVMPKKQAQQLWKQLRNLGVSNPILMPAKEFDRLYPDTAAAG